SYGVNAVALPIGRKRLRGALALRGLIARGHFDVVNTHSSTDTWLAALACRALAGAPPIVRTRHISAPLPANAPTRWLYTRAPDSDVRRSAWRSSATGRSARRSRRSRRSWGSQRA